VAELGTIETPIVLTNTLSVGHLVLVSGSDDESTLRGFGGGGDVRIRGKELKHSESRAGRLARPRRLGLRPAGLTLSLEP
jgi:hypothetical protein